MSTIALSVQQPWAYAILHLGKNVENRSWLLPSKHLGVPILLHTGKNIDKGAYDALIHAGFQLPPLKELPVGGIVGSIVFSHCDRVSESFWAGSGLYHWHIKTKKTKILPFVSVPGRLGFFDVNNLLLG